MAAVAARHDLGLGRRARLDVPERHHRLLHPEIVGWSLELRCRAAEAIAVVEHAAAAQGIQEGELVLGSDNGSAFTARRFKAKLAELGITHRRGGYRDPESQAFIESWFGKLKEREVWLNE